MQERREGGSGAGAEDECQRHIIMTLTDIKSQISRDSKATGGYHSETGGSTQRAGGNVER